MSQVPEHLAIIMDGNNRWARENDQTIDFAYRKGAEAAERVITECSKLGVRYLTLYTFSSENWNRPTDEVNLIMLIFKETMLKRFDSIAGENIRIIFIGERSRMPQDVLEVMEKIEVLSENNSGLTLSIAVSYGSRDEIAIAAFEAAQKNSLDFESYLENFKKNLNPKGIPDPDLMIRTSGEIRISNFLLWQLAYSELYFTKVLWPDFKDNDLHNAFNEFKLRHRRFGKR